MKNSLRILGCYSGSGGYERFPSSQLLILNKKFYLIDCGEGTQFLLKKSNISVFILLSSSNSIIRLFLDTFFLMLPNKIFFLTWIFSNLLIIA